MSKEILSRLLLRPAEAAEVLGVSRSRAYELIAAGIIPAIRLDNGRSIRVPVQALRDWVAKQVEIQEGR